MEQDLEPTVALLARAPAAFDALLRDLPEVWTHSGEGPGTWSACTVIAHLIHGEHEDWIPRARLILERGEAQAFTPFDREGHLRFSAGKRLPQLLDEFARLRAANLDALRALNLMPADLARRGRHPALGAVTLAQLLAAWAAHDLSHLHQVSRVMAHQYRQAVGPWSRFLGVMQCAGHSMAA